MGCARCTTRTSRFVLKTKNLQAEAPVFRGLLFCVFKNMALAYTSSNAVPTSTRAFIGYGPLVQQSMQYGQEGSVAESPSGTNFGIFISKVPFATGTNVASTGAFIFSNETGSLAPMEKLTVLNYAPVNKHVVWVGINAVGTGFNYMSTGVGIPLSGGQSIEFGGPGLSPIRNAWAITAPTQSQTVYVYGQHAASEAL